MLTLCGYIMCHSQYVQFLCLKLHFVTKKRAILFFFKHLTIFNKKGQASLIKTDEDSVFTHSPISHTELSIESLQGPTTLYGRLTHSHAEFLLSFSIDQSFKRLSKLVCVTGTLEKLNLGVNLIFFSSSKIRRGSNFFFCTAIKMSHRPKF